MTLFIALAAAMVLLALLLVIVPLLRSAARTAAPADGAASLTVLADEMRDLQKQRAAGNLSDAEYEQERLELERQALQAQTDNHAAARSSGWSSWAAALAIVIALPLLALGVYRATGTPAALDPALLQAQDGPHESSERAIAALEQRLAAQPDDARGWILLGRSYSQLEQFDRAAAAYRKAVVLDGDSPDLLIEYANALAITRNRDLSGEPEQLIMHALELAPDHLGALTFAGLAAFQRNDMDRALQYWQHLVTLLPADSEGRQRIEALIARTEAEQRGEPLRQPAAVTPTAADRITGSVRLAPELADRVQAGDTLFIFARASEGPPMPLAAVRTQAGDWPVAFRLDDSSAMVADRALSNFASVDIVARVSRQGSASAQPGDLEGAAARVAVGSQGVDITIDRVVP